MVDGVAVATGIVRGSVKVWCPLISYIMKEFVYSHQP